MLVEIEIQKPDVIVITELFPKTAKATDISITIIEFQIEGYIIYVEEKSRGVGIYIKDHLSYTECSALNNRPFKDSCWCELLLKNNEKMIGAIYRSPSSGVKYKYHTCHISHCEIKSHRIWPIWKPVPIRFSNLTELSDQLQHIL